MSYGLKINSEAIHNLARNMGKCWNGDFEGSCVDFMDTNPGLKNYVRIGTDNEYVYLHDKHILDAEISIYVDYGMMLELYHKRKDNYDIDYMEYYYPGYEKLVEKLNVDIDFLYINFLDYIINRIVNGKALEGILGEISDEYKNDFK